MVVLVLLLMVIVPAVRTTLLAKVWVLLMINAVPLGVTHTR